MTGYRDRPDEQLAPQGDAKWMPLPDEILATAAKIRSEWPDGLEPSGLQLSGIRKNRGPQAGRCVRVITPLIFETKGTWADDELS